MWSETCKGLDEGVVEAHLDDTVDELLVDSLDENNDRDPSPLDRFLNTSRRFIFVNRLTAKVPSKKKHC